MEKKNTMRRAKGAAIILVLSIPLLVLGPSMVGATLITFNNRDIKSDLEIVIEEMSGGLFKYEYTLLNKPNSVAIHTMNINWMVDGSGNPLVSVVEFGVLDSIGGVADSKTVPPASPYDILIYDGLYVWDWGDTYSTSAQFSLDPGNTLDTIYVVYDDFVASQKIIITGSGGIERDLTYENDFTPVPEPATLLLLGLGLSLMGLFVRRRKKG